MHSLKLGFFLIFFVFIFSSCTHKKTIGFSNAEKDHQVSLIKAGAEDYKFLWSLPKSWKLIYDQKVGNFFISEFLPNNQNLASWSDMITMSLTGVQVGEDIKGIESAYEIALAQKASTCKKFIQSNFQPYEQFGLPTLEFYYECHDSLDTPGVGEANLYKVILANQNLGLITLWRTWKIRSNKDLKKIRSESAKYLKLFREARLVTLD